MAQLVDIEDLVNGLEKYQESYRRDRQAPGLKGVTARCALVSELPLNVWRTTELNSGTDPRHIIQSIMLIFVGALVSEIVQIIDDPDDQIRVAGSMGLDIQSRLIKAIEDFQRGNLPVDKFFTKQAGRA